MCTRRFLLFFRRHRANSISPVFFFGTVSPDHRSPCHWSTILAGSCHGSRFLSFNTPIHRSAVLFATNNTFTGVAYDLFFVSNLKLFMLWVFCRLEFLPLYIRLLDIVWNSWQSIWYMSYDHMGRVRSSGQRHRGRVMVKKIKWCGVQWFESPSNEPLMSMRNKLLTGRLKLNVNTSSWQAYGIQNTVNSQLIRPRYFKTTLSRLSEVWENTASDAEAETAARLVRSNRQET